MINNIEEDNFIQIKNGLRLDTNNTPFKIEYYDYLIKYFENIDEYEKCRIILTKKNIILNHDSNYIMSPLS